MEIEGVNWTKEGLVADQQTSFRLAEVQFEWAQAKPEEVGSLKESEIFVPLYLNKSRQDLIASVKFDLTNCALSEQLLYQRGIALLAWSVDN